MPLKLHTRSVTGEMNDLKSSIVKLSGFKNDPDIENYPPPSLPLDPRNLLADLIEFASVVMQGIHTNPARMNTCNLCFKIISQATKNLRHRKSSVSLLDRSSANTMAAVLLDLLIEFFSTHLMKSFPHEIHGHCLDICFHLLSHQKEHNIRLDYDWGQLWKALFDLMNFVIKSGGPPLCGESFTTLLKVVGIFNFFISFGDCFLLSPSTYDELYYEVIRMTEPINSLSKFGKLIPFSVCVCVCVCVI
ncbi:unnamed protein product [Mesocestoides corti]|uniref:Armadillo-like helical domain-containing protein n=1 Tax=Mesocestoides corti TaxID=53468 RepID=A0A0R3UBJ5_MESCO|nr:unnamed protein product [Mesocestoides corti]